LIIEDERQRGVAQNAQTFRMQNQIALNSLNSLSESYDSLRKDKSGDKAIGGARSLYRLKAAESAEEAILLGRQDAARGNAPAAPLAQPGRSGTVSREAGGGGYSYELNAENSRKGADPYAQQSRFISGKSFFQNGEQWIDSEVQKAPNAKRVRVQFNSPEYFALLRKDSKVLAWLSQGRNVQFVFDGAVYEIYE